MASPLVALGDRGTQRRAAAAPPQLDTPARITADDLAQSDPRQYRWLAVPCSRIVANPYDFNQTTSEVQQNSGPQLPLSAGYYAGNAASRVPSLLSLYRRPAGSPNPQPPATTFVDDFDSLDPAWTTEPGLQASVADSKLTLVLSDSAPYGWGAIEHTLTVDVDTYPVVAIDVASSAGHWALKVNVSPGTIDTPMLTRDLADMDLSKADDFLTNVRAANALSRIGTVAEVGAAVVFLAGESSSYITGSNLVVDGGFTAVKSFYAGSGTSPGPVAPSGQFWSPRAGRLTVRRWLMSSGNGTASC